VWQVPAHIRSSCHERENAKEIRKEIRESDNVEIDSVSGGSISSSLSSAVSEDLKNFGGALQTAARG
jgi:hypothetical protein